MSVSSIYIAQLKSKMGGKKCENCNIDSAKDRKLGYPKAKDDDIRVALKYFAMI